MLSRLTSWADANRDLALDVVRLYLGLGLLVRGIAFLAEPATYTALLPGETEGALASFSLAHYVGLAHLAGGLMLALGLLTRVAAAFQIPILLGAAFWVHLPEGVLSQSFAFSALVLVLLGVVLVWGGGRWSLDRAAEAWLARSEADEAARTEDIARDLRNRPRDLPPAPERGAIAGAAEPVDTPCTCGHDRDDEAVELERHYAGVRRFRFLTGTHPRPTSAVYRCQTCGGVVAVVDDVDRLEALRFERPAPASSD